MSSDHDQKPRVLVVEADQAVRDSLIEALRGRFDPTGASGVLEAMALLEKAELNSDEPGFAAVVSDYLMPGGSGLDLVRAVTSRWPGIGTLLLTTHQDRDVQAAKRDGTLVVLYKPVDITDVLMWVDHVVTTSGMFKLLRSLRRDNQKQAEKIQAAEKSQ